VRNDICNFRFCAPRFVWFFRRSLTLEGEDERIILPDASEVDLKTKVVKPYNRGKALFVANELIPVDKIRRVRILVTEELSETLLERERQARIDSDAEWNRQEHATVFFRLHAMGPDDLADLATDVTPNYIKGPPGTRTTSVVPAVVNHPWISGIAGTLIAAVLAKWFGLA